MKIDIIEEYDDFKKLRSNWDDVYQADPEAQFFLSWTWLFEIFTRYRKGWLILAVRPDSEDSKYVSFFPLRIKTRLSNTKKVFYNEIHVAGTFFWSDYSGFICNPDFENESIPLLSGQLKKMNWRELILKNISVSKARLDLFLKPFEGSQFYKRNIKCISKTSRINKLICPYVNLPDSFDGYLKEKVSSNTRQKIRRFLRRVESSSEYTITQSTPETYERDINALISYWKIRWADKKGRELKRLAEKYRLILRHGSHNNTLFMPVLWRHDKPLGVLGSFIDRQKDSLLYFVAGRDQSCTDLPVGMILHAYSIRWAIENGLKLYEFLRGDEPFKYSYGSKERRIKFIVIGTKSRVNLNRLIDPRSINDVLKWSTELQSLGKFRNAETGFQQVLEASPRNEEALFRYARFLDKEKKFSQSKKLYTRLLDINKENIDAQESLTIRLDNSSVQ